MVKPGQNTPSTGFIQLSPDAAVLGIDTTALRASVGVARGGRILSAVTRPSAPTQRVNVDEILLDAVDAALEEAGLTLDRVAAVGVGIGPGVFTGTRIGLATAKALALGRGLPIAGVVSLVALARAHGPGTHRLTLDAGRGEVYAATVRVGAEGCELLDPPHLRAPDPAPGVIVVERGGPIPEGAQVALEAALRLARGEADDPVRLEPCYVRPSDAKLPG